MNLIAIILLIFIAITALLFIFYRRVAVVFKFATILIFAISMILLVSAVLLPQTYHSFAESLFGSNNLATQLSTADQILEAVASVPAGVISGIQNLIGQNGNNQVDVNLYNGYIDFIAGLMRITGILVGVLGVIISLYVRYSFAGMFEAIQLRKKIYDLENRIDQLENVK